MWVLIVTVWLATGGAYIGGYQVHFQEFTSEQNCTKAADQFNLNTRIQQSAKAVCVPK